MYFKKAFKKKIHLEMEELKENLSKDIVVAAGAACGVSLQGSADFFCFSIYAMADIGRNKSRFVGPVLVKEK